MEQEIRKNDGLPFTTKAALSSVLAKKGIAEHYDMVEEDGEWIGTLNTGSEAAKSELIKCRVYRSNVDPDNKDMPISVTVNNISNKKIFWPGEEVLLSQAHIDVLKNSIDSVRIPIPAESGIYSSANPEAVARNFYPSMMVERNRIDNTIIMTSKTPNFIIETIG